MSDVQTALVVPAARGGAARRRLPRATRPVGRVGHAAARDGARARSSPPARIDDPLLAELGALFAEMPSFACRFEKTGRFPGVLYLAPEPIGRFRALTTRLARAVPRVSRPTAGRTTRSFPHLTVLHDCADCLCERVGPRLEEEMPLVTQAREVLLYQGANAEPGWVRRARFPLGAPTA